VSEVVDVRTVPVIVDVHNCARCAGEHPQLQFLPLYNAPDDITHWASCPAIGQPILLFASTS